MEPMTNEEKIEQVEQALDGTRELIAEVRELATKGVINLSLSELHRQVYLYQRLGHDLFDRIWKQATRQANARARAQDRQAPRIARKFYGRRP